MDPGPQNDKKELYCHFGAPGPLVDSFYSSIIEQFLTEKTNQNCFKIHTLSAPTKLETNNHHYLGKN